jgi:hypothetical protein
MILNMMKIHMNRIKNHVLGILYIAYIFGLFIIVEIIDYLRQVKGKRNAFKYSAPQDR